ncbi:hypothetical protein O181_090133 [Austropuccinia psidii MF-1]|uniref:Uncharacterized protein n=1 Tax=Austropuccinia psidii MF-1 TaxID=1389203 RepID=A0A9Q3IUI7_9BASI|nr:hypothetical protein [Austropuccinia psidii MF-1]
MLPRSITISSFKLLSQAQASHSFTSDPYQQRFSLLQVFFPSCSPVFLSLQHPIHLPFYQMNLSRNRLFSHKILTQHHSMAPQLSVLLLMTQALSPVQLPLKARQTSASSSKSKPQRFFHQASINSNITFLLKSALTTHEST